MNPIPDPLAVDDVHLTLPTADREASAALYRILTGATSDDRWAVQNGSVGVSDAGEPLTVDLRVADLTGAADLLRRRGLDLAEQPGAVAATAIALTAAAPLRITGSGPRDSSGAMIDHVVLTVADADRAIALFGGRLGINLRLVRELGNGVRQLFFRTRSTVLEVVAGAPDSDDPGSQAGTDGIGLMGIAWRCTDIVAEQQRLIEAGLAVSEVRAGRKAGTRVCTIREPHLGTATLLIEQ